MHTLLQFAYATEDESCHYWQDYVVVESETPINTLSLHDYMMSMISHAGQYDTDYRSITERIMDAQNHRWWFLDNRDISIDCTHTFWI